MTEYISKDQLHEITKPFKNSFLSFLADEIDKLVDAMKPADVRPIVHGKWLKDYKMPTCSVCGNAVPFPDQYCSNCGSKMDLDIANYVDERGRENG